MSLVGLFCLYFHSFIHSLYLHWELSFSACWLFQDSLSLLFTRPIRAALNVGLSILRMEVLGGKQDRCCCCWCRRRLEVHVTTRAKLLGPGGASTAWRVAVHAGTLATCHFPTVGREGMGEGWGKFRARKERWEKNAMEDRWKGKRR